MAVPMTSQDGKMPASAVTTAELLSEVTCAVAASSLTPVATTFITGFELHMQLDLGGQGCPQKDHRCRIAPYLLTALADVDFIDLASNPCVGLYLGTDCRYAMASHVCAACRIRTVLVRSRCKLSIS